MIHRNFALKTLGMNLRKRQAIKAGGVVQTAAQFLSGVTRTTGWISESI